MSEIFDTPPVDIEKDVIEDALIHQIRTVSKFSENIVVSISTRSYYTADDCTMCFHINKRDVDSFLLNNSYKKYKDNPSIWKQVKSWFK